LISIVTPSLNRAAYIAEAIESVLHQDRADFEHIIVDGGSQDATAEILQRYPHLRVINEPDRGLYDAINKGIGLAKGEVIGFLNTDDCYEANVFGTIAQLFEENPNADALVGGSTIFRETQSGERQALACFSARPERDLLTQVSTGLPPFNGWFFRKELFQRIGYFNIRYQYSADRDLLIRMALMGVKYLCVDQHVYRYRQHPDSLTFSGSGSAESQFFLENTTLAQPTRDRSGAFRTQPTEFSQSDYVRATGPAFRPGMVFGFYEKCPDQRQANRVKESGSAENQKSASTAPQ
jgi:glycosyltransferase involved in cell wall biosynthesis